MQQLRAARSMAVTDQILLLDLVGVCLRPGVVLAGRIIVAYFFAGSAKSSADISVPSQSRRASVPSSSSGAGSPQPHLRLWEASIFRAAPCSCPFLFEGMSTMSKIELSSNLEAWDYYAAIQIDHYFLVCVSFFYTSIIPVFHKNWKCRYCLYLAQSCSLSLSFRPAERIDEIVYKYFC